MVNLGTVKQLEYRIFYCLTKLKDTVATRASSSGKDASVYFVVLSCSSFQAAEASLKHLDSGYFLGKVCFMVTDGTDNAFGSSVKLPASIVVVYWCSLLLSPSP